MKVWVPKQREVKVEVVTEANEDLGLKVGDLQVTDADQRTRVYSPAEFEERFEEIEKNSWPGYLKRKAGDVFMNGTLVVTFEGDTIKGLGDAQNAWAADPLNRHLILGDHGDKYFQGIDGRFYAVYYCYSSTSAEAREHLAEREAVEQEIKEKWEEKKKQLGIDERNALEKAQAAREAQAAIDRTRMRELLKAEADAKHCKANHGKAKKGKK